MRAGQLCHVPDPSAYGLPSLNRGALCRVHPRKPLSHSRGLFEILPTKHPISLGAIVSRPERALAHSSVRRCLQGGSGGSSGGCQRQFHRTGHVKPARITSSRSHNSGRLTSVASCFMLAVDIKRLTCTNQRLPSSIIARRVGPACARSRFEPSRCFAPNPENCDIGRSGMHHRKLGGEMVAQ